MDAEMDAVLKSRVPVIEQIMSITRQPGLTIGVVHRGREVFKQSFGFANVSSAQKINSDTLFCIASLTKGFITGLLDVLVSEGKLSWDSPIHTILPDFEHQTHPELYRHMTVEDICSHRAGLLSLNEIIQGFDGRILFPESEVLSICNALPACFGFRTSYLYNNALYSLAGRIIEAVEGRGGWFDALRERILEPLSMRRTTASRGVHDSDMNIATPYVVLTNGNLIQVPPTELSAGSMNGASGALRSSVNDLLAWCKCLLVSLDEKEHEDESGVQPTNHQVIRSWSPVFQRNTIPDPQHSSVGDYCAGWCFHQTPTQLGFISPNRKLKSPLLGKDSFPLSIYGHQGNVSGFASSLYLVPSTASAVVVLSNGTGLSDATDWIAQDLIESMHALKPAHDFGEIARVASLQYLARYQTDIRAPLERNRIPDTTVPDPLQFQGSYSMPGLECLVVEVFAGNNGGEELLMTFNGRVDQLRVMKHYHFDVWCHLPEDYDELLRRGVGNAQWSWFLVCFRRNSEGAVSELSLKCNGVDVWLRKACKSPDKRPHSTIPPRAQL